MQKLEIGRKEERNERKEVYIKTNKTKQTQT